LEEIVKTMRTLLLFVGLTWTTAICAESKEGVFLQAGLLYYTESLQTSSSSQGSSKQTRATTNFNALGGYSMGNSLALGLKYYNESAEDNWKFSDSSSSPESETSALGPAVGVQLGNFAAFGSYLALQAPEKKTGSLKYNGGTGYIIDLMYLINMGGWSFGPQVSMINFQYKKSDINGVKSTLDPEMTEEYVYPYFSFFVQL
jgi:hypothetical protein